MSELTPEEIALKQINKADQLGTVMLDLKGLGLSFLPKDIGKLQKLLILDLGIISIRMKEQVGTDVATTGRNDESKTRKNFLDELPIEVGNLSRLTTLNLSGNQFTSIPSVISQLPNIKSLDLTGNPISTLKLSNSSEVDLLLEKTRGLDNLTSLDLSNCQITFLPPEIGKFDKLTKLRLMGNEITLLPHMLYHLTSISTS